MRPRTAAFRRPLDQVFAAPSHIAILRPLLDSAEGMSGRQVARLAEINHQACAVALGRLEEMGVVSRQGSGQSQLFRLNREHRLVQDLLVPLLRRERAIFLQALQRIGSLLAGHRVQALVFGSAARREERKGSDLDLLLIPPTPARLWPSARPRTMSGPHSGESGGSASTSSSCPSASWSAGRISGTL